MKFCSQCGRQLPDEARFCNECGADLNDQTKVNTANMETRISPVASSAANPGKASQVTGAEQPVKPNIPPISAKPQGKGLAVMRTRTIITGIVIALLLVAGGFWGWRGLGSEARVQQKLDLAVKYLSENNFEEAILAYNEAIKIEPREVKAYQGLARVYTLQGKYDDAKATYDKGLVAVEQDKKQTLQMGLAGMYIDQGQLASAEKAFQEIKNSDKACLEAYWGLAMVYQKQGDNSKAEAMLKQAVDQNPNEYRAYNTLALYLKQNNKGDEAFNNLVKSMALEFNQQEAYLVLSDLYKGRWSQLQAKLAAVSNQQVSATLEFYSYYAAGDYQKALTIYNNNLSQQAGNRKARALAAIAMVKTGDKAGAETLVSQLSKEKLNEWLLSDLAYYYQAAGDKEKAREYAIKALQANCFNLDAIALLQTLNNEDASIKLYTAQALLYNWKPVAKVKEEIRVVNIQPSNSVSNVDNVDIEAKTQTPAKANTEKPATAAPQSVDSGNQRVKQPYNHYLDQDLIHAVGDVERVKKLLKEGADPNARDDKGWTALEEAAYRNRLDSVKVLLAAGANVNTIDILGGTPLCCAAQGGYLEIVEVLLDAGANVNVKDYFGFTALDRTSDPEIIKLLRDHGAEHGMPY